MGEIKINLKLENDGDVFLFESGKLRENEIRKLEIEALVDTGAVMLLLPQDLVEVLGLKKTDRAIVSLANDEKIELDIAGTLSLTTHNRRMKTDCLVGPPMSEPLVGQIILERLDLIIDPVKQIVTPRPESPYLPSLKLK
jgi:clan AA aspartic protease